MRILTYQSFYVVCFLTCTAQLSSDTENNTNENAEMSQNYGNKNVLITSEAECDAQIDVKPNLRYRVQMSLLNSSCPPNSEKKGFSCRLNFHQKDSLALVGSKLCIDIQGIPQTLPDTQLSFTVFNQLQQTLKSVYVTSRLLPKDAPYYICSNESQSTLSVSLSVFNSVVVCPKLMDKMVVSNISFGSIMMKPLLPTYILSMENCPSDVTAKENEYILKVASEGNSPFCSVRVFTNHSNRNTNSCIELIYVSLDYNCNISMELFMSAQQALISFDVPLGSTFPAFKRQKFCKFYSGADKNSLFDSVLIIQKSTRSACFGNFAVKATFTESDIKDTADDNYVDNMRQMYMAVFISLISACLLILCAICLFCLRMRSKRLGRTQRRGLENAPVPNIGFEASDMDLSNEGVSWSSGNPSEIYGLPTYDEICGKNLNMTAHQILSADEKPPNYDDLFSSSV